MSNHTPAHVKAAAYTAIAKAIDLEPILWEDHEHLTEDEIIQAGEEMKNWEKTFDALAETYRNREN